MTLLQTLEGGVLTLTLNRPGLLNALDLDLLGSLRGAFDQATAGCADGTVRAVLLTGAGRGFSSGADLGMIGAALATAELDRHLRETFNPLILAMRALPAPIVVAVNGPAAGAGMSLALAGDIVLAGRSATFLQAFTKIGLVPDAGSTYFLPRLVGDVRARALTLLAEKVDAERALAMGLVWKVYDDDRLLPEATALVSLLATQPTRAFALTKRSLEQSAGNGLAAQLAVEAESQRQAGHTEDFREGVSAFLAKRPPVFRGR